MVPKNITNNLFLLSVLFSGELLFAQSPYYVSSITQNLRTPVRIAIDNADTVYVTDARQKLIVKYDPSGNYTGTISTGGSPISVAINGNNQVFIGDGETGHIFKLNSNGTATEIYSGTFFPSSMVCVSDSIYIADSKLKQVIVIDQSGNYVRTIGSGTFTYPSGIAFNPVNNRLLVSEHGGIGDSTVQVVKVWMFDLSGNVTGGFGSYGDGNGEFYRIQGLDVDRYGNIYVPDPFQGNVTVFNDTGLFITKFCEFGNTPGKLNIPLDIAINSKDSIWITSMNNGSLEVYKINYITSNDIIKPDYAENGKIVNLYPNPSGGKIIIEINNPLLQELRIEIINMVGQKMYSKNFKTKKTAEQVDLSGFSDGIYAVKLISNEWVQTDQLVLSK